MKRVDYYFWVNSDWAYLGVARLEAIAARHNATVDYRPVDLPYVYSQTGGVPLSQRAPERQAYREVKLRRWYARLGLKINVTPKFTCQNGDLASCMVIAAKRQGMNVVVLSKAIGHAERLDEQDISSSDRLISIAQSVGLDGASLWRDAEGVGVRGLDMDHTQQTIQTDVFGLPSYVYRCELFWDKTIWISRSPRSVPMSGSTELVMRLKQVGLQIDSPRFINPARAHPRLFWAYLRFIDRRIDGPHRTW